MRLPACLLIAALLGAWKTAAPQGPRGPAYPPWVRAAVPNVGPQLNSLTLLYLGPPAQSSRAGGCALAQLSLGLAGMVLGGGGTAAVSDGAGPPLVAAGVGVVGGLMLGSYASRCHVSVWGAAGGAALGVLIGATLGKAFAETRSERDDSNLAAAYVVMLPLAWFGAQLGR